MKPDVLVQMANAIGQFFESMPDREEALDGVAQHLRRYWEPRMRAGLLARFDEGAIPELHPLVASTLATRRESLRPVASSGRDA